LALTKFEAPVNIFIFRQSDRLDHRKITGSQWPEVALSVAAD
jgi:hypothetical protein